MQAGSSVIKYVMNKHKTIFRLFQSLSTVVLSIGMGPMPAIMGYDVQILSIIRHP